VAKRGRKPYTITDQIVAAIELHAGQGMTLHQIAIMIDIGDSTLDRWMAEPRVKRAYERGRLQAHGKVAQTLFEMAIAGDTVAAIFYLKAQAGWSDKQPVPDAGNAQVVFYLPQKEKDV
jgi:metal-dependent HD superfamily phosphatase/phosphodiesterase